MNVTVFSIGDASDISTWSNVPYFATNGLEEAGYIVRRINISDKDGFEKIISAIYKRTVVRFVKIFNPNSTYEYSRSFLRRLIVSWKIRNIISHYGEADIYISLTFSAPVYKHTDRPTINICDWTYEFEILHNQKREPDAFERKHIRFEQEILEHSKMNVIFRADCREMLMERLDNIYHRNTNNMVNINIAAPDKEFLLEKKLSSNKILFLGALRYLEGARVFIHAVAELMSEGIDIEATLIGIRETDLDKEEIQFVKKAGIKVLGYLRKSDIDQNEQYYDEIINARIVVNTNPGFVSIASIKEACYLYTPVIVSKHTQTIEKLYDLKGFGLYRENDVSGLKEAIRMYLCMRELDYRKQCIQAHETFSDSSWANTMSQIVEAAIKD